MNVAEGVDVVPHLSCTGGHVNVCFDINGVLLKPNLDVAHGTALHPALFKRMMRSHAWVQYQEGRLAWPLALQRLSLDYNLDAGDIQRFVDRARASLAPVADMVRMVAALEGKVRMFCLTNAAKEDHDNMLAAFPDLFRKFERVFYSSAVGTRKPGFACFRHFLQETGCAPAETIFVDDTAQNVVAAEVLGFTTVLVKDDSPTDAVDLVVYYLRTEAERLAAAREYLGRNRGVERSPSLTSDGLRIHVHYDHFVIAELLGDPSFLPLHEAPATGSFNFFAPHERRVDPATGAPHSGKTTNRITNQITHKNFPDDLDTTAVALSALYRFAKVDMGVINGALAKMLGALTEDGLFGVYFDPSRARMDHVVQAIVCKLFHLAGQPGPVREVEAVLRKLLQTRAYLLGSLYYPLPEVFLWHMARLAHEFQEECGEAAELQLLVAARVGERVGMSGSALALAMRVLACGYCGVSCGEDRERLARVQKADGSWGLCPFYTYHDPKSWIGNEVTTTAFAVAALQSTVHK